MRSTIAKVGLLTAVAVATLSVAGLSQAQSLNLLQAWQQAARNDAAWLAAQAATRAGVEVVPIARADLRPQVSLSSQRGYNDVRYSGVATDQHFVGGQDALTLRVPLYRPVLSARLAKAEAEKREVLAREDREAGGLLTRVGEAYFDVLSAQSEIELLQAQIASAELQLDAARQARHAGSGTRTDEDEARARLDLLLAQRLEAGQALTSTRQTLERILQQPVHGVMGLPPLSTDTAASERQPARSLPALSEWLVLAEQANADLRALQAQFEAAEREVSRARAAHKPTLDLQMQYLNSDRDTAVNPGARYRQSQISLQLSIPLYSGGGIDAALRQALAAEERARHALEAARREVANRVTEQWRAAVEGQARSGAYLQAVRSAEQRVDATMASYRAGVRSNLDVLDAQEKLATAHSNLARTRLSSLLSELRLSVLADTADEAAIARISDQLALLLPLNTALN